MKQQIIPLNIFFTYSVKWTRYQVLRDFVQNFYDVLGPKNWKAGFIYQYESEKLSMEVHGSGFSYEWLIHIGASTKTESPETQAGYFGEGFKIAALCAYRDFGWEITMASREWRLKVGKEDTVIDGRSVAALIYTIEENGFLEGSRLEIDHISEEDYHLFSTVLESFYYPENKMFGKPIWESRYCAIYERSSFAIPKEMPDTYKFGRNGALFLAYQMRGTCPLPLVFCLHEYVNTDRERGELTKRDVTDFISVIANKITPRAAITVLESMRRYWSCYSVNEGGFRIDRWRDVIYSLCSTIMWSGDAVAYFREKYPNLLYIRKVYTNYDRNRRRQAISWMRGTNTKYKLVRGEFRLFGYPLLEDLCEEKNGFAEYDKLPDKREKESYAVLEKLIKGISKDFFPFGDGWPELRVSRDPKATFNGRTFTRKERKTKTNCAGLKIMNNIRIVTLREELLREERFDKALSVYVHELCHVFGGDSSKNFSKALMLILKIILSHRREVEDARKSWRIIMQNTVSGDE